MTRDLHLPMELIKIIQNMYLESKGILLDSISGDIFEFLINKGVKQGDGTSPELFTLFFDRIYPFLLKYYSEHNVDGSKRHVFTLASLQLMLLAFADDLVLLAPSPLAL
jgi:Reverse transcriptase (RNA-dependent DNA polymerase)